ncbi:MAG: YopX family protein [Lutibacter sp.]|jgi:hypothetical protein
MERTILFRGQRKNTEWMFGDLLEYEGKMQIVQHHFNGKWSIERNDVVAETVGQFTGETDIKGIKIFEKDKVTSEKWGIEGTVIFDTGCFSVLLTVANCLLWDVGQKPALFEFDDLIVAAQ